MTSNLIGIPYPQQKKKKILKSDVDIDIDTDEYDFLILIGSEPFKYFTKKTSITAENGRLINDKYLPVINPAMITFRPEAKKAFEEAVQNIKDYISGDLKVHEIPEEFKIGIEDTQEAYVFLTSALVSDSEYVSLDCETSALSPRDGYMIGFPYHMNTMENNKEHIFLQIALINNVRDICNKSLKRR